MSLCSSQSGPEDGDELSSLEGRTLSHSSSCSISSAQALQQQLRIEQLEWKIALLSGQLAQKSALVEHMDDELDTLTTQLFQEAYRMVAVAKEAEMRADRALAEERSVREALELRLKVIAVEQQFQSRQQQQSDKPKTEHKMAPIDPVLFAEFVYWLAVSAKGSSAEPSMASSTTPIALSQCAFMRRVWTEDIEPALHFENNKLSSAVRQSVLAKTLEIEWLPCAVDQQRSECALCGQTDARGCAYKMRTAPSDDWHPICAIARMRLVSVCDFVLFTDYVREGLLRWSPAQQNEEQLYWTAIELRRNMTLSRLGIPSQPRMDGSRPTSTDA